MQYEFEFKKDIQDSIESFTAHAGPISPMKGINAASAAIAALGKGSDEDKTHTRSAVAAKGIGSRRYQHSRRPPRTHRSIRLHGEGKCSKNVKMMIT